jgi:hypothetical protein
LPRAFSFGAALYTSVGHAGGSAYIALMALLGVAPTVMRPTALALNVLVASFTSFSYIAPHLFRWRTPLALRAGLNTARVPRRRDTTSRGLISPAHQHCAVTRRRAASVANRT